MLDSRAIVGFLSASLGVKHAGLHCRIDIDQVVVGNNRGRYVCVTRECFQRWRKFM